MRNFNFLTLVWIVMATSGIVFVEPAPIDIGIIILVTLGALFSKFQFSKKIAPIFFIMYFFLMANVISFFAVNNLLVALRYFFISVYLILSCFFYIGIVGKYKDKAIKVLFSGYIFAAISSAMLTLAAYFSIIPDNEKLVKFGRATGFFKDPNVFGPFVIPVALYALSKIEKNNKRLWWFFVFFISSASVLLSYSRAAWGSYALALFVYFSIKFLRKPNVKTLFTAVILICAVVTVLKYLVSIPRIQYTLNQRFAVHAYDADRFAKQDQAVIGITKYPLGIGPGQTELTLSYATHNGYLRIWLENGHIGFFFYISFVLISLCLSIRKVFKTGESLYIISTASILSILLNSFVIDTVHWRHIWFIFAIPWFSYSLEEESILIETNHMVQTKN